ncbi:MAG: TIGR01212 family radical SAM protein [Betaproteobacteria bacterium]|nr:TIGR01212 family radical SAM protein [Betaproteobacteria bacterium]
MVLPDLINTFGRYLRGRFGEPVHKVSIDAGFTCPNRDGTKGVGGCTFCNNESFSPATRIARPVAEQIAAGREVIVKRTGARRYLAYFQAYTNTYGDPSHLDSLYRQALAEPDVVGLSVGTRPDCVSADVLDLLAGYREEGYEVWLELGLQSAFDETLARVNRGHGFAEYREAVIGARARGLPVCTHLIVGLPGETREHCLETLDRVLELGTDGMKLHPLHVVKHTRLAIEWKRGGYVPLGRDEYISIACDLIERTPENVVFHRVTGTASKEILLAPEWCSQKWNVLNGIARELERRGSRQGTFAAQPREQSRNRHVA